MEVSVIVVSYNTRDLTTSCLESIHRHSDLSDLEVIVIDNASRDGSAETIAQQYPLVRLQCNSHNVGFAAAVNHGVSLSRGNLIILVNSDVHLHDDAFGRMAAFARLHPSVAIVGCRVTNQDGSHQPSAGRFPSVCLDFSDLFLRPLRFLPPTWRTNCVIAQDFRKPRPVDWVAGSCLLLRREALESIGGFDPEFFLGEEDIDLSYRLRKAHWQTMYLPWASVVHLGGQSKGMNPRSAQLFFMGRYRFYRKHYSRKYAQCYRALLLLSVALKWFISWATSAFRADHSKRASSLYATYWKEIQHWNECRV